MRYVGIFIECQAKRSIYLLDKEWGGFFFSFFGKCKFMPANYLSVTAPLTACTKDLEYE